MRPFALALALLFSVSAWAGQADDGSLDILWQIRPPDFIQRLAAGARLGPNVRGLAWYSTKPCIVMTPAPPPDTAPEAEIRSWLWLINHERRHCREKRNFHK